MLRVTVTLIGLLASCGVVWAAQPPAGGQAAGAAAPIAANADAPALSGAALVKALRQGGYVLLMRHASSPPNPPDSAAAEPDNTRPERQLDDTGKTTARAMGEALRRLGVPIGRVLSSPTYRALQTARLEGLPAPETFPELGDGGQSMQAASGGQGAWLRGKVADPPRANTNTVIITHLPNIRAAYAADASAIGDGEALVLRPDGKGGAQLLGRIKIGEWPALAQAPPA